MNTIEIPEKNIKTEYPSCWDEMNNEQFGCVMQNWLKVIDGKLNIYEYLIIVLYNFLGIKRAPLDKWKDRRLSKIQLEDKFANIWQLTETLNWLYTEEVTENKPVLLLNYYELKNRIPEIENSGGVKLIGPADGMLDITFGEYRRAWDYCELYGRWRKMADLDKFIATLYRPERQNLDAIKHQPDFDGNHREPFNPYLTEHYAELLGEIPFWKKYTIWLWFFNCDRYIKEEDLDLNGRPLNFAPLFSRNNNNEEEETLDDTELGLTKLLYAIAESNLFGPLSEVDRTNYIDVLTALLYWKQQADKIKS